MSDDTSETFIEERLKEGFAGWPGHNSTASAIPAWDWYLTVVGDEWCDATGFIGRTEPNGDVTAVSHGLTRGQAGPLVVELNRNAGTIKRVAELELERDDYRHALTVATADAESYAHGWLLTNHTFDLMVYTLTRWEK